MCISFSKLKKKIIWVYTRFRIFFYITKKTKVLRGNLNIDLVFILESFPLEIDSICADTKNKIFKRWGHVGSQAILEIISKMFLLAQNVHQNLVICHCWCSRLLVRVSWLKRGSPERQFPGGEMLIRALSFLTFFFFQYWKVMTCFQSLISMFLFSLYEPWNVFSILYVDWLSRFMKSGFFCQCAIHL